MENNDPIPITTVTEEAPEPKQPKRGQRPYRLLPARPIMVYPESDEQRRRFEQAAAAEKRRLSPFICWLVDEWIKAREQDDRMVEMRKRFGMRATGT